jgi:uncharacterized membrane protein YhaH (DUF805 family)
MKKIRLQKRLSRWNYFKISLLLLIISWIAYIATGALINIILGDVESILSNNLSEGLFISLALPHIIIAIVFIFFILATALRLRDIGLPGYLSPVLLATYQLPENLAGATLGFLLLGLMLFVFLKKGDRKSNKYGQPPEKGGRILRALFNVQQNP